MKLGICVRIKETISRASILLTFVIRYSSSSLTVIPVYYPPPPQKKEAYTIKNILLQKVDDQNLI